MGLAWRDDVQSGPREAGCFGHCYQGKEGFEFAKKVKEYIRLKV